VGHEYGLSQRLIHVPLLIRSPGLPPGRLSEPVSTRNLYAFVDAIASGRGARPELLVRRDEYGLLSERYKSRRVIDSLGPQHDRAWVSLIDAGIKGVGPSADGFEILDVDTFGFDRELPIRRPAIEAALRSRIDRYWSSQRDRRTDAAAARVSDGDREALRALGYSE
jgi:hypothetical protein